MKKYVLLAFLLGITAMNATAQDRILKTADDGFQWYHIYDNGKYGAESVDGTVIIPLSRGYSLVSYFKGWFYIEKYGNKGVCDLDGREIIAPNEYTFVCFRKEEGHVGYFSVEIIGKQGVCNINGREIIAPDKYTSVYFHKGYFFVNINDKKGVCDTNGREIITPDKYTSVYFYKREGHVGYFEVGIKGKIGACDIEGKEIITPRFKSLIYTENIGFEYGDGRGFHPLGITLDENGKGCSTKPSYPSTAQSSNDNDGQSRASRIAEGLSIFAEALQAYGEAMNGGQQPAATVGGSGSDNVPSGKSCSFYQDQYRREENFVKTMYSGMTSGGGYSKKDSQGNDREGKTSGDWGSANHSTNMKNLRAGQQRMRKIRQEAQRNGCSIPQSNYETVTVSY